MKYIILTVLIIGVFILGYSCNRKEPVTVSHYVAAPSTNHYRIRGDVIVRAPLPQSIALESSDDGKSYTPVFWGNETFGDHSFGWYEVRPKGKDLWLKVLPKESTSATNGQVVFVVNE